MVLVPVNLTVPFFGKSFQNTHICHKLIEFFRKGQIESASHIYLLLISFKNIKIFILDMLSVAKNVHQTSKTL